MINTLSLTQVLQSAAAEFPSALSILLLLLKVTGFLLIALLATFALQRKSAGTRHLVWLIALAALLIVPVLAVWSPLPVAVLRLRSTLIGVPTMWLRPITTAFMPAGLMP